MGTNDASPLGIYLTTNKISLSSFSRALGSDIKSVTGWARGETVPTLACAWEIERVSKGVVPMESWLALPAARSFLAVMHSRQSDEIRKLKQEVGGSGGGFAEGGEL